MSNLTERSLSIIWCVEESDTGAKSVGDHEEVNGLTAYGFWKQPPPAEFIFPYGIWPSNTSMKSHRLYDINAGSWYVILWDIRLLEWPNSDKWEEALKQTLNSILEAGARIAWFGVEGNFIEPPFLFDSKKMPPGGVYAAFSKEFGFKCTAKLGIPYKGFNEEDFFQLKALL